MTEIIDRPSALNLSPYRAPDTQAAYDAHRENKHEAGNDSCDMCRLAGEKKLAHGVLDLISPGVSIIKNNFGYRLHDSDDRGDGFELVRHDLLIPNKHHASMSDLPPEVFQAFVDTLKNALNSDLYNGMFSRTPDSDGSSIKDHLHFHLYRTGRRVEEWHFSRPKGINDVRFKGDPPLNEL
jgi:diadenosine tetraphosphate (Ap4A) HIT family hydrolase